MYGRYDTHSWSRGLSGSTNLTVQVKFVPDQPLLPWQRKFEYLTENLLQLGLYRGYVPDSCTKQGVVGVDQFNCGSEYCLCHGNENLELLTENPMFDARMGDISPL